MFNSCLVFLDIAADDARLGGRIHIMTSEVLNYDLALGVAPEIAKWNLIHLAP